MTPDDLLWRRARLTIEATPPGVRVELPKGGTELELFRQKPWSIGRFANADVRVLLDDAEALQRLFRNGWGGRTTCLIRFDSKDAWVLEHLGHGGVILQNGLQLWASNGYAKLANGDRIEPSAGLVFRFWEAYERVV